MPKVAFEGCSPGGGGAAARRIVPRGRGDADSQVNEPLLPRRSTHFDDTAAYAGGRIKLGRIVRLAADAYPDEQHDDAGAARSVAFLPPSRESNDDTWVPIIPCGHDQGRTSIFLGAGQRLSSLATMHFLTSALQHLVPRIDDDFIGINLAGILQMASNEHNLEPGNRHRTVRVLCRHMDDALRYQRDYGSRNKSIYLMSFFKIGKVYGAYVSVLYGAIKFLYLINILGQFFLLNRFLETAEYPLFGGHVVYDLLLGREWRDSGKFPRVTLCDFEIRVLGNIHRHTVQCVLVINMFTEKIFIFLWLWYLLIFIATVGNVLFWLATLLLPCCRVRFIRKYLDLTDAPHATPANIRRFVMHYMRPDGVLILRMVASRAGKIVCAELALAMWMKFVDSLKVPQVYDESDTSMSLSMNTGEKDHMSIGSTSPDREHNDNGLAAAFNSARHALSSASSASLSKQPPPSQQQQSHAPKVPAKVPPPPAAVDESWIKSPLIPPPPPPAVAGLKGRPLGGTSSLSASPRQQQQQPATGRRSLGAPPLTSAQLSLPPDSGATGGGKQISADEGADFEIEEEDNEPTDGGAQSNEPRQSPKQQKEYAGGTAYV